MTLYATQLYFSRTKTRSEDGVQTEEVLLSMVRDGNHHPVVTITTTDYVSMYESWQFDRVSGASLWSSSGYYPYWVRVEMTEHVEWTSQVTTFYRYYRASVAMTWSKIREIEWTKEASCLTHLSDAVETTE